MKTDRPVATAQKGKPAIGTLNALSIGTMGSVGFLVIFMAVNIANVRLAKETGGHTWISVLAAISTAFALIVLCVEVDENPATRNPQPATRNHLWILLAMVMSSLVIEMAWRRFRAPR
jgi:hypothetical protein